MISTKRALRFSAILLLFPGSPLAPKTKTQAEEEAPPLLEVTTVVANRFPTSLPRTGSAVTVLTGESLNEAQVFRLEDALRRVPGALSLSTGGQLGSVSSLFLRGTSTSQTHLRVDGVRLSDSTVSANHFLGNATLDGVDRIEVLRGPQSALYGGESIGGVVGILSRRGEGPPSSSFTLEGGSFSTLHASMASQGSWDNGLAYALALSHLQTDNDPRGTQPLDHEQLSYAMRLDYQVGPSLQLGTTFRGGHADLRDTFGGENFTDYQLITLFADWAVHENWDLTLRFGSYEEAYDYGDPSTFATDAEKRSLAWENSLRLTDDHTIAFGSFWETTDYAQDFAFPADRDQHGAYLTHFWEAGDALTLTTGARWEDYDDYGDEFTWRATAAYHLAPSDTTFHASYGTAFRTPNLLELNGSPFDAGNPALQPERSEGWDIGVRQSLGAHWKLDASWFENEVENLIVDPFGAAPRNTRGKGNANGLEVGLEGHSANDQWRYGLAYTYLQRSLIGLPEHLADLHLQWKPTPNLILGGGLTYVDDRHLGGDPLDNYLLARLHARWTISENVSWHARVENALDERYEHASFGGIPTEAARLGVFTGVTMNF